MTPGYVYSVPGQGQTQLVRGTGIGSYNRGQSSLMIPLLVQVIIKIPINPKNFMSIKEYYNGPDL